MLTLINLGKQKDGVNTDLVEIRSIIDNKLYWYQECLWVSCCFLWLSQ